MKKLIAILVVFAIVTGAAFAQVAGGMYVNAWGQGAFSPLILQTPQLFNGEKSKDVDGEELGARTFVGIGNTWGGGKPISTNLNVGGWSENVGFYVGINPVGVENGHGYVGGNIWARPFSNDFLKITIGDYTDDTLRGKVSWSSPIGGWVLPDGGSMDYIFHRIGTDTGDGVPTQYGAQGFMFSSLPVDGLFIALNVNTGGNPGPMFGGLRANDAYRALQAAVGYNISGIGLVRAQWIGGWVGSFDYTTNDEGEVKDQKMEKKLARADFGPEDKQGAIQAAFNLTAIDGLSIDVGFRFNLPVKGITDYKDNGTKTTMETKKSEGMVLGLGLNLNLDLVSINFLSYAKFGAYAARYDANGLTETYGENHKIDKDKNVGAIDLDFRLTPAFNLDFAKIGIDLAFHMSTQSKAYELKDKDNPDQGYVLNKQKDNWYRMGFGVWISKGLGSGNIDAGISFTTPTFDADGAQGSYFIQVPVVLTYAFF